MIDLLIGGLFLGAVLLLAVSVLAMIFMEDV